MPSGVLATLSAAWVLPLEAKIVAWLFAVRLCWTLFGASLTLLGAALWFNMVIFPYIALAVLLLLLTALVSLSSPGMPDESTKKGK